MCISLVLKGITQEEIDDWHRVPECEMLADMEALYKAGADLDRLDAQGASMVGKAKWP